MRLADEIIAKAGGRRDRRTAGAYTELLAAIMRAERFDLSDDTVSAIDNVRNSNAESIRAASSFARMPFNDIWIEWTEGCGAKSVRYGIIASRGETDLDGNSSMVLRVENGVVPVAYGVRFDFRDGAVPWTLGVPVHFPKWGSYCQASYNQEDVESIDKGACWQDIVKTTTDYDGDFLRAFLIMLQIKDFHEIEKDDFHEKNKIRKRLNRPPLQEFAVTRLSLKRRVAQIARGESETGEHRNLARQHLVRGHFKIRKTGVFWWAPYVRGNPDEAIPRERYRVVA